MVQLSTCVDNVNRDAGSSAVVEDINVVPTLVPMLTPREVGQLLMTNKIGSYIVKRHV